MPRLMKIVYGLYEIDVYGKLVLVAVFDTNELAVEYAEANRVNNWHIKETEYHRRTLSELREADVNLI